MKRIAFIGSGNMASAISAGIIASNVSCATNIYLFDKNTDQYNKFHKDCKQATSIENAVETADYVFLSVKPQNIKDVLNCIKNVENISNKVFISICAGITIKSIENALFGAKIVRVMPNTPLLIGQGVSALCKNESVSEDEFEEVKSFFSSSGLVVTVQEDDINNITALSGSAPAYVYLFIKIMCDSIKKLGFDNEKTTEIVCKVFQGSAQMILDSDKTVDELIQMVKSPNGTTERALNVFEASDLDDIIFNAMKECANRAEELSKLN